MGGGCIDFVSCIFRNNSADYGGAVYYTFSFTGGISFKNCIFKENKAYKKGDNLYPKVKLGDYQPKMINTKFE